MKQIGFLAAVLVGSMSSVSVADTVVLNNGVQVDGKVKQHDGYIEVDAGGNTVFYRDAEITSIEANDKTGKMDLDEIQARWELEEAELIKKTGLTVEQRRAVDAQVFELGLDAAAKVVAREKLIAMQSEMDVFRYLRFLMASVSHYQLAPILEAMYYLDSNRAVAEFVRNTQNSYYEVRAKAMELLGTVKHKESIPLMARGLADEYEDVQIQSAYALARTGAREATPALIELMEDPDLRIVNASRESLALLWKDKVGDRAPNTIAEWKEIWEANAGSVSGRIQLAMQQPLVLEEEEFVAE